MNLSQEDLDFIETLNRFFIPDQEMLEWIVKYANGRLIIDVGCGQGDLGIELTKNKGRVLGIDPFINLNVFMRKRIQEGVSFNILPVGVQDKMSTSILSKLPPDSVMYLVARPCHSNFVVDLLNMKRSSELLYITLEQNLTLYDDLGPYKGDAVQIFPEGNSHDNEVFYSIK